MKTLAFVADMDGCAARYEIFSVRSRVASCHVVCAEGERSRCIGIRSPTCRINSCLPSLLAACALQQSSHHSASAIMRPKRVASCCAKCAGQAQLAAAATSEFSLEMRPVGSLVGRSVGSNPSICHSQRGRPQSRGGGGGGGSGPRRRSQSGFIGLK